MPNGLVERAASDSFSRRGVRVHPNWACNAISRSLLSGRELLRQCTEVHVIRGAAVKCAVRPTPIIEFEIRRHFRSRLGYRIVGMKINMLVLDRLPQPLDEHVGVSSQLRRLATIRADVAG